MRPLSLLELLGDAEPESGPAGLPPGPSPLGSDPLGRPEVRLGGVGGNSAPRSSWVALSPLHPQHAPFTPREAVRAAAAGWTQGPGSPPVHGVTLGSSFDLSGPRFSHLHNGADSGWGCCEGFINRRVQNALLGAWHVVRVQWDQLAFLLPPPLGPVGASPVQPSCQPPCSCV